MIHPFEYKRFICVNNIPVKFSKLSYFRFSLPRVTPGGGVW